MDLPTGGAAAHRDAMVLNVLTPASDVRAYSFMELPNGVRLLLVCDPEATFAAACVNVQVGYFDDPPDVPGLAHLLEHCLHLGTHPFPVDHDYKSFLSQHGGSSNASTGMAHTQFHLRVHHGALQGALARLGAFFSAPLLDAEAAAREVDNVHAEYSRNCNSDARKLLQLRRSAMSPPLSLFSTGSADTLRDGPEVHGRGLHVAGLLRQLWESHYTGGSICACVVAPQPLHLQQQWAADAMGAVRPTARPTEGAVTTGSGAPPPPSRGAQCSIATSTNGHSPADHTQVNGSGSDGAEHGQVNGNDGSPTTGSFCGRYGLLDVAGSGAMGHLFHVAPQRDLRQLELSWYIPFGTGCAARCKPWRLVGHVLGHEGPGSVALLLKQRGLVQELSAGIGDEVKLGDGFMFWGVTVSLTEAGLKPHNVQEVLLTLHRGLQVLLRSTDAERRAMWDEVAACSALRWDWQDRAEPLQLARDAAHSLHHLRHCRHQLHAGHAAHAASKNGGGGSAPCGTQGVEGTEGMPLLPAAPGSDDYPVSEQAQAQTQAGREPVWGPEWVLASHSAMTEYNSDEVAEFLSHLRPDNLNVYLCSPSLASPETTPLKEKWYGARYGKQPLPDTLAAGMRAAMADTNELEGSGLGLPERNWALPVDLTLRNHPTNQRSAAGVREALAVAAEDAAERAAPLTAAAREFERWCGRPAGPLVAPVAAAVTEPHVFCSTGKHPTGTSSATTSVADASSGGAGAEALAAASDASRARERRRLDAAPSLLQSLPSMRVWHQLDTSFGIPKAHVHVHLVTRDVYRSPAAWVAARLAVKILDEALQPVVYPAQLVGAGYSLACSETGLSLHVTGFSGVALRLARMVASGLAELPAETIRARFDVAVGRLRQQLRVWRHNNPLQHAEYAAEHLLQVPHWHAEQSLACLTDDGPTDAAGSPDGVHTSLLPPVTSSSRATGDSEATGGGQPMAVERHATPAGVVADGCHPTAAATSDAARRVGPDDVIAFVEGLGRGLALEVLCYGNVTSDEALELSNSLQDTLRAGGSVYEWPDIQVVKLCGETAAGRSANSGTAGDTAPSAGGAVSLWYVPTNPNPTNKNTAAYMVWQLGEDEPQNERLAVLLDLFVQIASKPCFHELRTKQRLGYSAGCAALRIHGTLSWVVRVQSPDKPPALLRERILAWVASFRDHLTGLPTARLLDFKASLAERYQEPPRSLADAAGRAWAPIRARSYAFCRRQAKAAALADLSLLDLIDFYDLHISPGADGQRAVSVELWPGEGLPHPPPGIISDTSDHQPSTGPVHAASATRTLREADLPLLQASLPRYTGWARRGTHAPPAG